MELACSDSSNGALTYRSRQSRKDATGDSVKGTRRENRSSIKRKWPVVTSRVVHKLG